MRGGAADVGALAVPGWPPRHPGVAASRCEAIRWRQWSVVDRAGVGASNPGGHGNLLEPLPPYAQAWVHRGS
jgi:hypothetical protein